MLLQASSKTRHLHIAPFCVLTEGTIIGFGKTIGLVQIDELGQLETPILLTNTLSVGRVADALVGYMLEQYPAIMAILRRYGVGACI